MTDTSRLEKLINFLKEQPGDPFLCFAVAKEHEKNNNLELALRHYKELKTANPEYVGTYYHLAKLYEVFDQKEEAINTYKQGIIECKKQNDMHSMAELTTAMANLEMDLD